MNCTRCDQNVPEGTSITPCCGVMLYWNGPFSQPGAEALYPSKIVDLDISAAWAKHAEEHGAQNEAIGAAIGLSEARTGHVIDGIVQAHNAVTEFAAKRLGRVGWQVRGLLGLNLVALGLALFGVHI